MSKFKKCLKLFNLKNEKIKYWGILFFVLIIVNGIVSLMIYPFFKYYWITQGDVKLGKEYIKQIEFIDNKPDFLDFINKGEKTLRIFHIYEKVAISTCEKAFSLKIDLNELDSPILKFSNVYNYNFEYDIKNNKDLLLKQICKKIYINNITTKTNEDNFDIMIENYLNN